VEKPRGKGKLGMKGKKKGKDRRWDGNKPARECEY